MDKKIIKMYDLEIESSVFYINNIFIKSLAPLFFGKTNDERDVIYENSFRPHKERLENLITEKNEFIKTINERNFLHNNVNKQVENNNKNTSSI